MKVFDNLNLQKMKKLLVPVTLPLIIAGLSLGDVQLEDRRGNKYTLNLLLLAAVKVIILVLIE